MTSTQDISLGLIGFGAFGRLTASMLADHFRIVVCDPAYSRAELADGRCLPLVSLAEAGQCDVVLLAVPVARMTHLCDMLAPHLRLGTLVMDVGSVKVLPVQIMRDHLPGHVEILGTHPLFGPQSISRLGFKGRKIVLCPVRGRSHRKVTAFLRALGLVVEKDTPEAHDRDAAIVQGLTHLVAKVLAGMGPLPERMTTASFDLLKQAMDMVKDDPPTVLHAIEVANPFAAEVRATFFQRAEELRDLFEQSDQ